MACPILSERVSDGTATSILILFCLAIVPSVPSSPLAQMPIWKGGLDIYRLLVRAGLDGMIISDIQTRLSAAPSTLAFHLGGLVRAGLVSQEKVGREVICRASHRQLTAVMEFLRKECCKGFDDEPVTLRQAS